MKLNFVCNSKRSGLLICLMKFASSGDDYPLLENLRIVPWKLLRLSHFRKSLKVPSDLLYPPFWKIVESTTEDTPWLATQLDHRWLSTSGKSQNRARLSHFRKSLKVPSDLLQQPFWKIVESTIEGPLWMTKQLDHRDINVVRVTISATFPIECKTVLSVTSSRSKKDFPGILNDLHHTP